MWTVEINNQILFQIRQWSNLVEVETSGVHSHLNDRSRICSCVHATKEALWLGRLAHTFRQVNSDLAPVVHNDSQSVVALSKNLVHHNASKLIDIRYHFVRDCLISRKIGLEKISTTDNVADGMKKCLSADHFRSLRQQMGVMIYRSG